jgi:hypothetical protein
MPMIGFTTEPFHRKTMDRRMIERKDGIRKGA